MFNNYVSSFMFKSGVAGPGAGSWARRDQTEGFYSSVKFCKGPTTLGKPEANKEASNVEPFQG